jgi:hypothetical protein
MKNNILIFLLGIFVIISIAATIPNTELFTVKPATPKVTIVIETRSENVQFYVNKYRKLGYVIKDFYPGAYYDYDGLLMMEKY